MHWFCDQNSGKLHGTIARNSMYRQIRRYLSLTPVHPSPRHLCPMLPHLRRQSAGHLRRGLDQLPPRFRGQCPQPRRPLKMLVSELAH